MRKVRGKIIFLKYVLFTIFFEGAVKLKILKLIKKKNKGYELFPISSIGKRHID